MKKTKSKYIIGDILDILICLMLVIMSLYKGAFYKEDSLFPTFVICLIGLGCLITKIIINIKSGEVIKKSKFTTVLDFLVILMPITYFMPVLFKTYASLESSIFESIRYVNFAICYFIARSSKNINIYSTCIIILAIVLSIFGIDEITYRGLEKITSTISIKYLSEQTNNISSTIQYANITAFIIYVGAMLMLNQLYKDVPELGKKKTIRSSMFSGLQMFTYVLLQSTVILTSSRMMTFLSLISIILLVIYHLVNRDGKKALFTVGLYIISFLLVSTIDTLIISKSYFNIYTLYFALLIAILSVVVIKHMMLTNKQDENKKIEKNKQILDTNKKNKKYIKIGIYTIVVIVAIIMIFNIDTSITLNSIENETVSVSKNIYTYKVGKNVISFKNMNVDNAKCIVSVDITDKNFNRENVFSKEYENVVDEYIEIPFEANEDTRRITINLSIKEGRVELGNFKLNDKKIILSYALLPDNMVFRFLDTVNFDSSNFLRQEYYLDAMKLFKNSRIVGLGGEAFKLRYQEVQETGYISSEVHSTPIQILLEAGIIGVSIYALIILLAVFLLILVFKKNKDITTYILLLILISFVVFSTFDLAFSFGIVICLIGILIGLIANEYTSMDGKKIDEYVVDNKSWFGTVKMGTMSFILILLFIATIYSAKIYFASMIVCKEYESDTPTLEETYERIGYLDKKLSLDEYNYEYIILQARAYDSHISNLNTQYVNETDDNKKKAIKKEIDSSVTKQKMLYDKLIEYEFYNKYALYEVAIGYFNSYIRYANIFKTQFKNSEVAYSFYLEYAMKITDRIIENAKINEVSKNMVTNIFINFSDKLLTDNKYLNSKVVEEVILTMNAKYGK